MAELDTLAISIFVDCSWMTTGLTTSFGEDWGSLGLLLLLSWVSVTERVTVCHGYQLYRSALRLTQWECPRMPGPISFEFNR